MHLSIFLLTLAGCYSFASATQNCLVGSLIVSGNVITSKSVELKECDGLCRKQTVISPNGRLVLLTCEENKVMTVINHGQQCSSSELERSCFCETDECNKVDLKEDIPISVPAAPNNIICYVGFYANSTTPVKTGDVVTCSPGDVCTSFSGVYQGYDAAVFACMPQALCDNIFPNAQASSTQCTYLQGTNIQGCCCYKQDCRELAPMANPPTPTPWKNKNNQTCYQGIAINGVTMYGGSFSQCSGQCGSGRFRTNYNGNNLWVEVFVCDPVNVFTELNLDNECKNIATQEIGGVPTALITGCACNNKDKCIDPTVVPPVYPVKQL